MDNKQLLGILGSVMLAIGVFMPLVSLPIVGSINYFHNGKGDGVVVLAFAFVSLLLVLSHRYRGLWVTSLLSAALLLFSVNRFQSGLSQMKADMSTELAGNPFRGLADAAVASIQLQWGLGVMVIGIVLLIIVAALAPKPEPETAPAEKAPEPDPGPDPDPHTKALSIVFTIGLILVVVLLVIVWMRG